MSVPQMLRAALNRITVIGTAIATLTLAATPASAAEAIRARYGPLELKVAVTSIEAYLKDGTVNPDLAAYLNRLSPEQLDSVEQVLRLSITTEQRAIAKFLYTRQGEAILSRLGEVVRTRSNSGFYALRAALILAAGEPGGLTALGFLQQFPTDSLIVDIERGLGIVREFRQLASTTDNAVDYVTTLSNQAASSQPVVIDDIDGPRRPGPYTWQTRTFTVNDPQRQRRFRTDLYLPERQDAQLIVISHGLGSDRGSFRYLAEHLASWGYAVAAPDHPGSDASYVEALLAGTANEVTQPREFADRPLDVTSLLDELEQQAAQGELPLTLDLAQVGIVGQSFGGYTALALSGAPLDFERLAESCSDEDVQDTLNLSLLLQCRALELEEAEASLFSLADERIAAAIAINPIGNSIFGEPGLQQITNPVMIMAGSADFVAPPLAEQFIPFTWLETEARYLVLLRNGTHFSTIGDNSDGAMIALPPELMGPEPDLAKRYAEALSLAFFDAHLRQQP
ncbi:MAG: alpha/beta fold hydrolase, partial [Cyanobacteria bacterium P01_A01_bin.135]